MWQEPRRRRASCAVGDKSLSTRAFAEISVVRVFVEAYGRFAGETRTCFNRETFAIRGSQFAVRNSRFVGSLVRWFVGSLVRGSLVRWFVVRGSLVRRRP
jgi:hypothetical protein